MKEKGSFSYLCTATDNLVAFSGSNAVWDVGAVNCGTSTGECLGVPASIQERKLIPYFQPIIGIASGNIIGYEALARQIDANGSVSSAGEIFSAPNIGDEQLLAWDRMVRRQALKKFSLADCDAYLTINISAKWIDYITDSTNLPTLAMLDEFNIDRSRIIIEITESKGDLNKLVEIAGIYRKQGLKVAIDDFGAGFSQLERVMAIKPDLIKLDMRLFKEASRGGIASDIVHLLTRLAKRTGCRIVCEGVETGDEFYFGLSCGAQYMQGFLFSPATVGFKNAAEYQSQIRMLRKKFVDNTLAKEQHKIAYFTDIKRLCQQLKNALKTGFTINDLPVPSVQKSGLVRLYLCDNGGEQVSSNFNFIDGKWFEDSTKIGFNWAWRPYFYQLLALESVKDNYPYLLASDRYRDFNSDMLCKTLSLRLNDEQILLIDIAAEKL